MNLVNIFLGTLWMLHMKYTKYKGRWDGLCSVISVK